VQGSKFSYKPTFSNVFYQGLKSYFTKQQPTKTDLKFEPEPKLNFNSKSWLEAKLLNSSASSTKY